MIYHFLIFSCFIYFDFALISSKILFVQEHHLVFAIKLHFFNFLLNYQLNFKNYYLIPIDSAYLYDLFFRFYLLNWDLNHWKISQTFSRMSISTHTFNIVYFQIYFIFNTNFDYYQHSIILSNSFELFRLFVRVIFIAKNEIFILFFDMVLFHHSGLSLQNFLKC